MRRQSVIIGLVLLAMGCLTSSAWSQKVQVDHDPSFDFSRLRTFAWDPAIPAPPTFSQVDANRVDSLVRQAVDRRLRERGFFQVVREPGFLVSYQVFGRAGGGQKRTEESAEPSGEGWRPFVNDAEDSELRSEGVLILSALEPGSKRVIWQARGFNVIGDPKKLAKQIDQGVQKMVSKLPRR